MEGVAMEVKKNIEVFASLGVKPADLRITGGGSRSDVWNQIMADVIGIPCGRGDLEESTAVGASVLAAYGAGEYTDIAKAADEMATMTNVWNPNPEHTAKYAELYRISGKIYQQLQGANLYADLAKFAKK